MLRTVAAVGGALTETLPAVAGHGEGATAHMYFHQALELHRQQSNAGGEATPLVCLSQAALIDEETDEAAALLGSTLRLGSTLSAYLVSLQQRVDRQQPIDAVTVAQVEYLAEALEKTPDP